MSVEALPTNRGNNREGVGTPSTHEDVYGRQTSRRRHLHAVPDPSPAEYPDAGTPSNEPDHPLRSEGVDEVASRLQEQPGKELSSIQESSPADKIRSVETVDELLAIDNTTFIRALRQLKESNETKAKDEVLDLFELRELYNMKEEREDIIEETKALTKIARRMRLLEQITGWAPKRYEEKLNEPGQSKTLSVFDELNESATPERSYRHSQKTTSELASRETGQFLASLLQELPVGPIRPLDRRKTPDAVMKAAAERLTEETESLLNGPSATSVEAPKAAAPGESPEESAPTAETDTDTIIVNTPENDSAPEALREAFETARQAYLDALARAQKGHHWGTRESASANWLLRGQFGHRLMDLTSRRSDEVEQRGQQYAEAMDKLLAESDMSEQRKRQFIIMQHGEDTRAVVEIQKADKKQPMRKWLRRAGYLTAAALGAAAATVAIPLGAAVAASGAAGIRMRANRLNANTEIIDQENHSVYSPADRAAEQAADSFIDSAEAKDNLTTTDLVDALNDQTKQEIRKNQLRVAGPVIGALAVMMVSRGLMNLSGGSGESTTAALHPAAPAASPEAPDSTSQEALLGQHFSVEPGHGLTHELQEFAQANGKSLTPQQSYELYSHLRGQFGDQILQGLPTYTKGGDLMIGAPGNAEWSPGVSEEIKQWMTEHSLW